MGEPPLWLVPVTAIGGPLASFFVGVIIADIAGLRPNVKRRTTYLIAIPTGFVITGMLIGASVVKVNGVTYYGYMQEWHKGLLFFGTIMLYGVVSTEAFSAIRNRVLTALDTRS